MFTNNCLVTEQDQTRWSDFIGKAFILLWWIHCSKCSTVFWTVNQRWKQNFMRQSVM